MTTPRGATAGEGMSREEQLALPAAIDLDTANRALSIGRSTGYALAKRGQYPVKILRLGNAYRVITADLLRVLSIDTKPHPSGRTAGNSDNVLCA
ncbi:integrase [Streptomyces durbertensis]|uniref:Integrase n=1 Tax=Streptomyces durbertensis TaxID=2448886 RepID=A0ABR6EAZ1_9ACTN|nr:integrase [Streptomyces durbertensis]MBB1242501.1 integrase [Streptomyces durbertensis]